MAALGWLLNLDYAATASDTPAPEVVAEERPAGGYEDYSNHPYLRSVREKEKLIKKQEVLEEQVSHVEIEVNAKRDRKPYQLLALENKLEALREELDGIKVLNALIAEQEMLEEEEAIFMMVMFSEAGKK